MPKPPASPWGYDASGAVHYHYGQFPPERVEYGRLVKPLSNAAAALARYDQMLKGMHSSDLLLAPLRSQEAVVSSRMEGTVSTLDEVLRLEAEQEADGDSVPFHARSETIEVFLYSRAMRNAQQAMKDGAPLSAWLIRASHKTLLGFGRGAQHAPGEFKTLQNYLADRNRQAILFIPMSPDALQAGLDRFFAFIQDDAWEILIRTAIAHLEFEAMHPFNDGNGRIGRMIIPLMLWRSGVIAEPHFYISAYFERRKDEYIDRMRAVSSNGAWTEWITFFLSALEAQATENLRKAEEVRTLYEEMKERFVSLLSSRYAIAALDALFTRPVFRNNTFTHKSGIPAPTAYKFTRNLLDAGLLTTIAPAAGRRPALYAFEPLLALLRD